MADWKFTLHMLLSVLPGCRNRTPRLSDNDNNAQWRLVLPSRELICVTTQGCCGKTGSCMSNQLLVTATLSEIEQQHLQLQTTQT